MSTAQEVGVLERIRLRGHWRVALRPGSFQRDRIADRSDLFRIVERNSVRLRGWDYPHIDYQNQPQIGVDRVGGPDRTLAALSERPVHQFPGSLRRLARSFDDLDPGAWLASRTVSLLLGYNLYDSGNLRIRCPSRALGRRCTSDGRA